MGSVFFLDLFYVATNIDLITASSFSLLSVLLPSTASLKSALLDCTCYSLQVVTTLLCLLCATSVRSLLSPLPGAASLVTEQTLSSSSVTDLADTGTESVDRSERVVPDDGDDDMEVAAILIFRPYYTYWENRVQRRRKQTS